MLKEICFFIQTPLTKRDYERFGVEILRSRGFKVTFLDLTGMLNPDYVNNYKPPDPSDYERVVPINKLLDLSKYLKENDICMGVDLICSGENGILISMYTELNKYDVKYASIQVNSTPDSPGCGVNVKRSCFGEKIKRARECLKHPIKNVKEIRKRRRLSSYVKDAQRPVMIIKGGTAKTFRFPEAAKDTRLIYAHTFDYDLYLRRRLHGSGAVAKNSHFVFLDEYNPFHPDMLLSENEGFTLDPDIYYGKLGRFFSRIEEETGLPVKIAAHPRSRYDLHPDYFQGRDVILGSTIELVFDAKAVLAHASTSINFAVLYGKPIIFLTSNEINKTNYARSIENMSRQFNKRPINVDENMNIHLDDELRMDEGAYKEYYESYIKAPGTPEKPLWEIVADNIGAEA
ncbi:MAG: hypothetical protein WC369_02270 [Dehalococcoidales bacterium]|jgi:hypothetical protein